MIDSHAHLTHGEYEPGERAELLRRAHDAGVERIVCIAFDIPSCEEVVEFAAANDTVSAVVGVHPHESDKVSDDDFLRIEKLAADENVVGVGEAGLDFYRDWAAPENQRRAFHESLAMAARVEKPVVIHCRDAFDETLTILEEHAGKIPGGVMHCYSGSVESMQRVLPLGFYISIPGTVTFPKKEGKLDRVARECPEDRLLIETDCPWLTPAPHRGKRNEPSYVRHVLDRVAAARGVDPGEIDRITTENTERLFGLSRG